MKADFILKYNNYTATLYKIDKANRHRKFWFCGNTGVAIEVCQDILKKLGYKILYEDLSTEE